jgi:hypothetical protein
MYRMDKADFFSLLKKIKPYMDISEEASSSPACQRTPNGLISPEIRLSAALRYFAGGKSYDIAHMHGIGLSTFYERCVWIVVDAINKCPGLNIIYPTDHEKQKKVVKGFEGKSRVGFRICAGAIDGMLVWIEQPRRRDCNDMNSGPRIFYCGRKHKFGLNLQAVCDSQGRFLEVWITHPGSSSDFIAFVRSDFYRRLTSPGFLESSLALFGDNAYVSTDTLVSPFKGARVGPKDDFNFYHSQLRINIECAFGMLVQRWLILRSPLSATMGVARQVALVMALCRLHNECIRRKNKRAKKAATKAAAARRAECEGVVACADELKAVAEPLEEVVNETLARDNRPGDLLDGGHHHDDVAVADWPDARFSKRKELLQQVVASGLERPTVVNRYDH